jgi:hypothetical protein
MNAWYAMYRIPNLADCHPYSDCNEDRKGWEGGGLVTSGSSSLRCFFHLARRFWNQTYAKVTNILHT